MSKHTSSPDEPITDAARVHPSLSAAEIFRLLSNATRVSTAAALARRERSISFDDLVTHLATKSDARDRERVCIDLRHRHLPMLSEAGVIAYEGEDAIARGPAFRRVEPALEVARDEYSE